MKKINTLTGMTKIGYGTGNLTYGLISQVVATYIVVFGTNILGISAALIGTAVSLSVIWDAVSDPIMGYISDNTFLKRFGRRHLYLIVGLVGMAIFNMLIWNIPSSYPGPVKYILLILFLLFIKTFITIYTTPYTALGAELSNDYNERSVIQGIRTVFFRIGIMIATVGSLFLIFNPTPEYPLGQTNPEAYKVLALITTLIGLVGGVFCITSTFSCIPHIMEKVHCERKKQKISSLFRESINTFKNTHFRKVVFGYLMANISGALVTTLGLHVYTYTFGMDNKQTSITMAMIFVMAVGGQPFWIFIAEKTDKKTSVIFALLLSMSGCALFIILVITGVNINGGFALIFVVS